MLNSLTLEDGIDRLARNVDKKLPEMRVSRVVSSLFKNAVNYSS